MRERLRGQILEFPVPEKMVFDGAMAIDEGFCVGYQYNIDRHGFSPYGFDTPKIRRILKDTFGSVIYWDSTLEKFVELEYPPRGGLYFFKTQTCLQVMETSLRDYQKAHKLWVLGAKYHKLSDAETEPCRPSLLDNMNGWRYSASFVDGLLESSCRFFIIRESILYTGAGLVLFDRAVGSKLKEIAEMESVHYRNVDSFDDLKAW